MSGEAKHTKPLPLMTEQEIDAFTERLADCDQNKMEFFGTRRWDAYRYVVPRVLVALGLFHEPSDADRIAAQTGIEPATVKVVLAAHAAISLATGEGS